MLVTVFRVYVTFSDGHEPQRAEAPQAVADRFRQLYEQGVPLFSKSTIRDLKRQLDLCRASAGPPDGEGESHVDVDQKRPIISIPAIDGTVFKTRLMTGLVVAGKDENTETVLMNPNLGYWSFQRLCDEILAWSACPPRAYCPTTIEYPGRERQIGTGRFLDPVDPEPPEAVQNAFDRGVEQWEGSPHCRRLRQLLDAVALPVANKVVAFACSTLKARPSEARTICQHAMALTVLDALRRRRQEGEAVPEIPCLAQDPAYTDTDKEVLARAGFTVVQDPQGFLEVDDRAVVISISPNVPIRQIIADIARPAVLIWDRVTGAD